MIRNLGYKDIIEVVRYHHNKDNIKNNKMLQIVSYCDNKISMGVFYEVQ